jgi:hypothetical protein
MRQGMSQRPSETGTAATEVAGISASVNATQQARIAASGPTGSRTPAASASAPAAKPSAPPASATGHPPARPDQAYPRQNPVWPAAPIKEPWAAPAAKDVPWSSARKNTTGPDTSGRATIHPLRPGPQRRPATLAPAMSGVGGRA